MCTLAVSVNSCIIPYVHARFVHLPAFRNLDLMRMLDPGVALLTLAPPQMFLHANHRAAMSCLCPCSYLDRIFML